MFAMLMMELRIHYSFLKKYQHKQQISKRKAKIKNLILAFQVSLYLALHQEVTPS